MMCCRIQVFLPLSVAPVRAHTTQMEPHSLLWCLVSKYIKSYNLCYKYNTTGKVLKYNLILIRAHPRLLPQVSLNERLSAALVWALMSCIQFSSSLSPPCPERDGHPWHGHDTRMQPLSRLLPGHCAQLPRSAGSPDSLGATSTECKSPTFRHTDPARNISPPVFRQTVVTAASSHSGTRTQGTS